MATATTKPARVSKPERATQKDRLIEVATSVPEFASDVLLVSTLTTQEEISGLFHLKLELLYQHTPKGPLDLPLPLEKLLGKPVSVSLHNIVNKQDIGVDRYFHGVVSRVLEVSKDKRFLHLAAEVVPWLWLLTQKTNCRVFQGQTVPEIVQKIVDEWKAGYPDAMKGTKDHPALDTRLLGSDSYTSLDHCIQYNETDFQFISRLLEEEGISYFFDHDQDGHALVLFDNNFKCKPCAPVKLVYQAEDGTGGQDNMVTEFKKQLSLLSGKYASRDHHFQLTGNTLENTQSDPDHTDGSSDPLEIFEYPGGYAKRFNNPEQRLNQVSREGDRLARVRSEEDQLPQKIFAGRSNCRTFVGGGKFTLSKHFDHLNADVDYILTSVKCNVAQSPDYISNQASGSAYRNEFTCVPFEVPIHPLRVTPKPLISGPQTAVVSVKQGEESWIDKFGRVRVQFPWDREGKNNETSTCWVRVAQAWAGAGYGAHFWPRGGQEVVVEFLEGDPDRPIITGSVYNSRNMPPYKLPDNHTRSGIQSRSTKDGASKNFNELRFEDKKGQEQIFLNAEKDMDHRVENDHRIFVGASQHLAVGGLQNVSIAGDHSSDFRSNRMEAVTAKFSLHVGDSHHQTVGQVYALKAGSEIHLNSDVTIVIEGKSRVSIKGPGGFIDIGESGIAIVGKKVDINSGGSAASGTEAKPDAPKKPDIADDGSKGTKMA